MDLKMSVISFDVLALICATLGIRVKSSSPEVFHLNFIASLALLRTAKESFLS